MKDNCGCGGNCVCDTPYDYTPNYKYHEDIIIETLRATIDKTYESHYATDDNLQCLDCWTALGSATTSCRDTALKYLWRYGKKEGNNIKDLYKALHFIVLMINNETFAKESK